LNRGEPAIEAGKKKKKNNNNNNNKAKEQEDNSKESLGSRGISTLDDAGASLHLSNAPTFQHISAHFREGEAPTLPFLNLKYDPIWILCCKACKNQAMPLYR
jgi:hypothetical protein